MPIVTQQLTRRAALRLAALAGVAHAVPAFAAALPKVVMHKDPFCGCCGKWAEHLKRAGFVVETVEQKDMQAIKGRFGVPDDLASCHTAEMAGYIIEGHVPAPALLRLLETRPDAIGLAAPGMPAGSPGMEGLIAEVFDVIQFGKTGRSTFGRYKGATQV